jgi:hypothetical protein
MGGVVGWFAERGEIPLVPPPGVREYCPLTDDPVRPLDEHFDDTVRGVACAIEYCDAHGWVSTRTIRALALDPNHPSCLNAYCHVRGSAMSFRVDRIVSVMDLRSGRMVSGDEHLALFAPYLAIEAAGADLPALCDAQDATRDGVFALLQVAMADGRLGDEARDAVLEYVRAEAAAAGCALPDFQRIELWVDNLAPTLDGVVDAVTNLLRDREKTARLLPWLLRAARAQPALAEPEVMFHQLFEAVRRHFREEPHDFPHDLRASR